MGRGWWTCLVVGPPCGVIDAHGRELTLHPAEPLGAPEGTELEQAKEYMPTLDGRACLEEDESSPWESDESMERLA